MFFLNLGLRIVLGVIAPPLTLIVDGINIILSIIDGNPVAIAVNIVLAVLNLLTLGLFGIVSSTLKETARSVIMHINKGIGLKVHGSIAKMGLVPTEKATGVKGIIKSLKELFNKDT